MTMNSLKIFILIFFQFFFIYSFSQSNSTQNSQFTVGIDAGHGGKDPGNTGNGFIEKDIALKISLSLGRLLENNGVNVIYTRKKDVFVDLFKRANIANQSDA